MVSHPVLPLPTTKRRGAEGENNMQPFDFSPAKSDGPPAEPQPLRAMLVVQQPQRRQEMLASLAEHAPEAEVEVVDQMLDALTKAMRGQPQLVVIDVALERPLAPVMQRYLKRTAPKVKVHLYDSVGEPSPDASLDSSSDSAPLEPTPDRTAEAQAELRAAVRAWQASQPPPVSPQK